MESAVSPQPPNIRTLFWAIYQLYNLLSFPAVIPNRVRRLLQQKDQQEQHQEYIDPNKRRTFCKYFCLSSEETSRLIKLAKKKSIEYGKKFTLTHLLSAVVLTANNALLQEATNESDNEEDRSFRRITQRFLLSVGLRPFGSKEFLTEDSQRDISGEVVLIFIIIEITYFFLF